VSRFFLTRDASEDLGEIVDFILVRVLRGTRDVQRLLEDQ
jgi:hypothetical protein